MPALSIRPEPPPSSWNGLRCHKKSVGMRCTTGSGSQDSSELTQDGYCAAQIHVEIAAGAEEPLTQVGDGFQIAPGVRRR